MAPDWEELEALAAAILSDDERAWLAFWLAVAPILEAWVKHPRFLGDLGMNEEHRDDIILLLWERLQQNNYGKLRAYLGRQEHGAGGTARPGGSGDTAGGAGGVTGPGGGSERARKGDPGRRNHFRHWLWRVLKNIGIDYLRSLPEYRRVHKRRLRPGSARAESRPASTPARQEGEQSRFNQHWHVLETLRSDNVAVRDPVTTEITVHRMLAYLDSSVPKRQVLAVELADRDQLPLDQIARRLGVPTARAASRVIARSRERMLYRRAVELWSQGCTHEEIAAALGLEQPEHAQRMISSAKELLKRHFRT